jgi:tRNA(Ile2) C34 agmatinyltransferase TiaS
MRLLIGLDDTDNQESRGTGHLARQIATRLAGKGTVLGVTRHQLLVDPRVPYTSHNSSAAIHLDVREDADLAALFDWVRSAMLSDFQPGSDPGLCFAAGDMPAEIVEFGRQAQTKVVAQSQARQRASNYDLRLQGLGGTEDGVIGALAAVGLAACGEDGRYLLVGTIRQLNGLQPVETVLSAGVAAVKTMDGEPVRQGLVLADKLRPARRAGIPVQYVDWQDDHWQPVKLN